MAKSMVGRETMGAESPKQAEYKRLWEAIRRKWKESDRKWREESDEWVIAQWKRDLAQPPPRLAEHEPDVQRSPDGVTPRQVDPPFVPFREVGLDLQQLEAQGFTPEVISSWNGELGISGADARYIRTELDRRHAENVRAMDRQREEARQREQERNELWQRVYNEHIEKAKQQWRDFRDRVNTGQEPEAGYASIDAVRAYPGGVLQRVSPVTPQQAAEARAVANAAVAEWDKKYKTR